MQAFIRHLGRDTLHWLQHLGQAALFSIVSLLVSAPRHRWRISMVVEQIFYVGVYSLPIIICSGGFVGMVLSLQGYTMLSRFGAEPALGQLVALSVVRELGPVVGGLLFAGRSGSALTAEIGLMKATEQLESLTMIGVEPMKRIVGPRFWAGIISMPILSLIFCAVAILGSHVLAVDWLHIDGNTYWLNMRDVVDFYDDVVNGIIKSIFFGFVVTWIAVYQGYSSVPTSEGISHATTKTVVYASLAILGSDFILTAVMFGGIA